MLGKREPALYGTKTLPELEEQLADIGKLMDIDIECFQSNIEGEIVSMIQEAGSKAEGVILNAGAYTHTSIAIRDAVLACGLPVIEVHLSNPYGRESFRRHSVLSDVCKGVIAGFGWHSYCLALLWFARYGSDTEEYMSKKLPQR